MKKFLIIIIMLFSNNILCGQTTAIPDPNFEAFLEANGMGDGIPNNGLVLTANIETVTELDMNAEGIADLTGIQDFTALEYLAVGTNQLSSLDVSQNLALETLGCDNNFMESIDLSNNTALKLLYCPVNNFTNLNLSQNVNLETVYVDENLLTSLIISSPALDFLWCNNNQITTLDLSSSPLLNELNANFNRLTSVNLPQSTALITLGLSVNNLVSLDLSQNTGLTYLTCSNNKLANLDVTENIILEELTCVGNNLSSLDVSQNVNLRILRAYENPPMSYLDIRNGNNEAIEFFDATNANLQCIYVDDASAGFLNSWNIHPNSTFANNEQECEVLGINEFTKKKFTVFPNPTKNRVNVITTTPANYRLISATGVIVLSGAFHTGLNKITTENLSTGIYFLKVSLIEGTVTKKLVKE